MNDDEIQELRAALRKFAAYAEYVGDIFSDDCPICTNPTATAGPNDLTVGDLRRARALLAGVQS